MLFAVLVEVKSVLILHTDSVPHEPIVHEINSGIKDIFCFFGYGLTGSFGARMRGRQSKGEKLRKVRSVW